MPERIVDVFEAIQIQKQHRDFFRVTRREGDRLADPVVQQHAIGQTGQKVVLGRMGHLPRHRQGRTFHGLALDGVAQRPQQPALLDLALDEIVLRAQLERLHGQRLVVQACEHDHGDAGRSGVSPPYRFQSLCIGQTQVEQDNVDGVLRKMRLGIAHALHVRQLSVERALLVQHLADKTCVPGVIFDQEECFDQFRAHPLGAP